LNPTQSSIYSPFSYEVDSFLPGSFQTQLGNPAEDVPPPWAKKRHRRKDGGGNEDGQGSKISYTSGSFQNHHGHRRESADHHVDLDQDDRLRSGHMQAVGDEGESLYNRIRQNRQRMEPRSEEIYDTEDGSETERYIPDGSHFELKENAAQFSDDEDLEQGSRFSPETRKTRRRQQGDFDAEEPSMFQDGYELPAENLGNKGQRADDADDHSSIATLDIRPPRIRRQRGGYQAHIDRRHDLNVQREPQDHWEGTQPDTGNVEGPYFDDYRSDGEEQRAFRKGDDPQWASHYDDRRRR
jgi:hypothetical protein